MLPIFTMAVTKSRAKAPPLRAYCAVMASTAPPPKSSWSEWSRPNWPTRLRK
uniref:Uncharacterized protein n=1 Tax=Arundo donax TaxID=35708 RepID=A0A0A9EYG3_ARUDO